MGEESGVSGGRESSQSNQQREDMLLGDDRALGHQKPEPFQVGIQQLFRGFILK